MTADGPASGLPQEAVDAAAEAIEDGALTKLGRDLGTLHRNDIVAAGLTAALPFLRQQWEAELPDPNGLAHLRTANALFEERAKVAALRAATIRECIDAYKRAVHHGIVTLNMQMQGVSLIGDALLALLPDVQADGRGTTTPTPATTCADCGTTRTLCDAGLNTYDTRCCGQCGHGEGK